MRISSLFQANYMLTQFGINAQRGNDIIEQLSTLKRVNKPSDDPIAASRLTQLNREQTALDQYMSNITYVGGELSMQEAHVKAVANVLTSINDKLLAAANDTLTDKDMSGFGQELASLLDSLLDEGNAVNENGSYVFSGTKNHRIPFQFNATKNTYSYGGNYNSGTTPVGYGVDIATTTDLQKVFSVVDKGDLQLLNKLKAVSDKMLDPATHREEYIGEVRDLLGVNKDAVDKAGALLTDLGVRQNRLSQLKESHTDISITNSHVIDEISSTDVAATITNMQLFQNSVQITYKAYGMLSQLSLFSSL